VTLKGKIFMENTPTKIAIILAKRVTARAGGRGRRRRRGWYLSQNFGKRAVIRKSNFGPRVVTGNESSINFST